MNLTVNYYFFNIFSLKGKAHGLRGCSEDCIALLISYELSVIPRGFEGIVSRDLGVLVVLSFDRYEVHNRGGSGLFFFLKKFLYSNNKILSHRR
jgi:hypothetical protein